MTPESTLRRICERNQVPYASAERLLPLVARALEAPEATRERILALVERDLQKRGQTGAVQDPRARDLEHETLIAVARVLHDWSPSKPLLGLGNGLGGLSFRNPESP